MYGGGVKAVKPLPDRGCYFRHFYQQQQGRRRRLEPAETRMRSTTAPLWASILVLITLKQVSVVYSRTRQGPDGFFGFTLKYFTHPTPRPSLFSYIPSLLLSYPPSPSPTFHLIPSLSYFLFSFNFFRISSTTPPLMSSSAFHLFFVVSLRFSFNSFRFLH